MKAGIAHFLFLALLLSLGLFTGKTALLDKAPEVRNNVAVLQEGATLFVNYCLNCHSLSLIRYDRLTELGFSKKQLRDNLMFTADAPESPMRVAAKASDQKLWFGVVPPDLSLIARSRASEKGSGADWLYSYLRSFYRDKERLTGWNNTVFTNVAMPHVFWDMQGEQVLNREKGKLEPVVQGSLAPEEYDKKISALVGFLQWAGEPEAVFRKQVGFGVLVFLLFFFCLAYALKREYWKEIEKK